MNLLLIRHGETNANLEMKWSGYNDLPFTNLTTNGKEQARKLCAWFQKNNIHPTRIYSSPQVRARETCLIATSPWNLPIHLSNDLRETNPGIFEGLSWKEIEKKYPNQSAAFLNSRDWDYVDGSESDLNRLKRGKKFINFLINTHSNHDTIFIFSHGGMIKQLIAAILETKKIWNVSPKNTSLFEFIFDKDNWYKESNIIYHPLKWKILKFNDTPHLNN